MIASAFMSIALPEAARAAARARQAAALVDAARLAQNKIEEISAQRTTARLPASGREGRLSWTVDLVSKEQGTRSSLATFLVAVRTGENTPPLVTLSFQRVLPE